MKTHKIGKSCQTVMFFGTLLAFLFSSCAKEDCSYFNRVTGNTQCLEAKTTVTKVKKGSSANCSGSANSRRLTINCSPSDALFCDSSSHASLFYAVLLPNDGSGSFYDSNVGYVGDCGTLWNYLSWGAQFSDIVAVYFANSETGERVTCTDAGGCLFTSTNCFSGWSADEFAPTGVAASLNAGTNLMACIFIDSPAASGGGGGYAVYGTPANSSNSTFGSATVASPIPFNTWTDF